MSKARLVIADDHAMFREGLAHLLPPEVELVAAVSNGNELLGQPGDCGPTSSWPT